MFTLYSIGHSVRPLADFLKLLNAHGIRQLADIRSIPKSRRHPQYCADALAASLAGAGIAYRHFPDLGGKRRAQANSVNQGIGGGWQAYADHMATAAFARALQQLIEWAQPASTAMMCAEAKPGDCHRQLTADALLFRGVEVRHITSLAPPGLHQPHQRARWQAGTLTYPARQGSLF